MTAFPSTAVELPGDVRLGVTSHGLTHRGQVRPTNEDHFLIAELTKAMRVRQSSLPQAATQFGQERGHLFLVADGMGGHQAGERASALAMGTIEDFMLNTFKWFFSLKGPEGQSVLSEFQEALRLADLHLHEKAERHHELKGMGTTLTMAYTLESDLFVAHVGDSRCYLSRGDELHQLTRDHTVAEELVRRGHLKPEEAVSNRFRHVVTNAVGADHVGVQVEAHKVGLEPGDRILLCSDGLTEMVPNDRIAAVLADEPDVRAACERLVGEANERGGKDNITAVLVRFERDDG
jgi:serine/threonine protein phosphatase PrpC